MPHRIRKSGVCHIAISDHSLIYTIRRLVAPRERPRIIKSRSFKNFDKVLFLKDLNEVPWDLIELSDDPNEMWSICKHLLMNVLNAHAPLTTKRVRNLEAPWLSSELRNLMFRRDSLKKRAIKNNSIVCWEAYRKIRNEVNRAIRDKKREYFITNIEESRNDIKKTWKVLNTAMSRTSKITTINKLTVNEEDITDPKAIADQFNKYFLDVGPSLAANIPDCTYKQPEEFLTKMPQRFHFEQISASAVAKVIGKLPANKATGLDNLPTEILKIASDVISYSLAYIFNASIASGIFPDDWKVAKVSPLYKANSRSEANNYRPISILPVVSKVVEKIIFSQMYKYLREDDILSQYQSGFRPLHSTMTALLKDTILWLNNMDKGKINIAVFLDLKKAFDTVDHEILLKKMQCYGIG